MAISFARRGWMSPVRPTTIGPAGRRDAGAPIKKPPRPTVGNRGNQQRAEDYAEGRGLTGRYRTNPDHGRFGD